MYKEHHVRTTLEVEMSKKRTPLWREAHFQVKSVKAEGLDHFLTFGRRKSVRRCGAKHMSKSRVSKTVGFGPLLDGQMSFCLACARDSAPCEK